MAEDEGALSKLPYRAEYAKSGRAACKGCKTKIEHGELRLAVMVQSPFFDGKQPNWYHRSCFFLKQKPKSAADIAHLDSLRWDDQELIRKSIGESGASSSGGAVKVKDLLKDYKMEYAVSGKSTCIACDKLIGKGEVRISKKDYESEKALMLGGLDRWHHVDCFVKIRDAIQFFEAGAKIAGFKDLDKEDKEMIQKKLPGIPAGKRKINDSGEAKPSKLAKVETVVNDSAVTVKTEVKKEKVELVDKNVIKKQNQMMYKFRDILEKNYKKVEFAELLTYNKQEVPPGEDRILDRLTDIMAFGTLRPCKICKTGQYVYRSGVGYQCQGYLTEYTKCATITGDPARTVFKVPKDYRDVFKPDAFKVTKRIFEVQIPTAATASGSGPKFVKLDPKPLKKLKFGFVGNENSDKTELEALNSKIKQFGGTIRVNVAKDVAAFILVNDSVQGEKIDKKVSSLKLNGIPVLKSNFMNRISETMVLIDEMKNNLAPICDWFKPNDIDGRIKNLRPELEGEREGEAGKAKSMYELPTETKVKLRMKDGAVVDPESGLEHKGHVLKEDSTYYNCVLNRTDVDSGANSYYKLQIIESDRKDKWFVFRAWGRIGTTIGGNQVEKQGTKYEAIDFFNKLYTEKTQNLFGKKFVKRPGGYLPMELDYGGEDAMKKLVPSQRESKLPMPIQKLVCLLFDVDNMKSALLEFELDLEKMPLGKLSRDQILKAYGIISEALELFSTKGNNPAYDRLMTDASNRFYTLIPHNFGTSVPKMLDGNNFIKSKVEMLESLMEIELAYELLRDDKANGGATSLIDKHMAQLKTDLTVVEMMSAEYGIIQKYLSNTHASTHSSYSLDIEEVFKVSRKGESDRYAEFNKLNNRKLLWHGSRTTNYVGILSQGLRIAPPEAPATGYMFGKGIYFADMVSKSANYCYTTAGKTTGILLLCEVALGDMYQVTSAKENLLKPPKKFHSVKGLGQTQPDPKGTVTFSNGVEVPCGEPVPSKVSGSELLYNEYIVYDPAQVKIRYLVKCNFIYGKGKKRR